MSDSDDDDGLRHPGAWPEETAVTLSSNSAGAFSSERSDDASRRKKKKKKKKKTNVDTGYSRKLLRKLFRHHVDDGSGLESRRENACSPLRKGEARKLSGVLETPIHKRARESVNILRSALAPFMKDFKTLLSSSATIAEKIKLALPLAPSESKAKRSKTLLKYRRAKLLEVCQAWDTYGAELGKQSMNAKRRWDEVIEEWSDSSGRRRRNEDGAAATAAAAEMEEEEEEEEEDIFARAQRLQEQHGIPAYMTIEQAREKERLAEECRNRSREGLMVSCLTQTSAFRVLYEEETRSFWTLARHQASLCGPERYIVQTEKDHPAFDGSGHVVVFRFLADALLSPASETLALPEPRHATLEVGHNAVDLVIESLKPGEHAPGSGIMDTRRQLLVDVRWCETLLRKVEETIQDVSALWWNEGHKRMAAIEQQISEFNDVVGDGVAEDINGQFVRANMREEMTRQADLQALFDRAKTMATGPGEASREETEADGVVDANTCKEVLSASIELRDLAGQPDTTMAITTLKKHVFVLCAETCSTATLWIKQQMDECSRLAAALATAHIEDMSKSPTEMIRTLFAAGPGVVARDICGTDDEAKAKLAQKLKSVPVDRVLAKTRWRKGSEAAANYAVGYIRDLLSDKPRAGAIAMLRTPQLFYLTDDVAPAQHGTRVSIDADCGAVNIPGFPQLSPNPRENIGHQRDGSLEIHVEGGCPICGLCAVRGQTFVLSVGPSRPCVSGATTSAGGVRVLAVDDTGVRCAWKETAENCKCWDNVDTSLRPCAPELFNLRAFPLGDKQELVERQSRSSSGAAAQKPSDALSLIGAYIARGKFKGAGGGITLEPRSLAETICRHFKSRMLRARSQASAGPLPVRPHCTCLPMRSVFAEQGVGLPAFAVRTCDVPGRFQQQQGVAHQHVEWSRWGLDWQTFSAAAHPLHQPGRAR
jgi:hypothetical protein